jgi:hypothetical protein
MITITNNGRRAFIEHFVAGKKSVHLFTSNSRPTPEDNTSDYREPAGNGYSPINLDPERWKIDSDFVARYPEVTFLLTGAVGNVYGYYITDDKEKMILVERFVDGPYIVQSNGHRISVNIAIA